MISRSDGLRAEFHLGYCEGQRGMPMTGANRSSFSRRTLLLLFVLAGMPSAMRCAALEDSAQELARKIAASLPAQDAVSIEIRNLSSLTPEETTTIEQALRTDLENGGLRVTGAGSSVSVRITLSESLKAFVWTAEILQADASRVMFVEVARPFENRAVSHTAQFSLHGEKFWEGPEPVLDAAIVATHDTEPLTVLLVPDGLLVRKADSGSANKISLDSLQSKSRDPRGALLNRVFPLSVLLESNVCTVALDPGAVSECRPAPAMAIASVIPGHGQVAGVRSGCGSGNQVLASGAGDYSQPDTLQAFEQRSGVFVPVTEEMNFPGPVFLQNAVTTSNPTAIVRNLHTGNYEAYHLSISCAP